MKGYRIYGDSHPQATPTADTNARRRERPKLKPSSIAVPKAADSGGSVDCWRPGEFRTATEKEGVYRVFPLGTIHHIE